MTYQQDLLKDRFAQAALTTKLKQPELGKLAFFLQGLNDKRLEEKGKPMSDDHLRQEAVKYERSR